MIVINSYFHLPDVVDASMAKEKIIISINYNIHTIDLRDTFNVVEIEVC